jgi:uncharacterized protein (TIRG00374 family)
VKKQVLSIIFKYGLGLGLLAWVIWRNWHVESNGQERGISGIFQKTFYWQPFLLALVIGTGSVFLTFVRWFVLVRAQELSITLYSAVRLGLLGMFYNVFLPGSVTGDIPKAFFLAREQSRRTAAVATVIMDRGLGLVGLVWLVALIGSVFWFTGALTTLAQTDAARIFLTFIVQVSVGLVLGSIVFWFLLGFLSVDLAQRIASRLEAFPKVGGSLAELWRSVLMYRVRGKSVVLAMLLAMTGHVGFIFILYLCSHAINPPDAIPSLGVHFLIVPVGMTIQAGFPAPGGIGGGELAFSWLYAQMGTNLAHTVTSATEMSPEGFWAAFINHCLFWILGILGYLIFLNMKPEWNPAEKKDLEMTSGATMEGNKPAELDSASSVGKS